nr:unnamed protein product [Callosobruchus analis]
MNLREAGSVHISSSPALEHDVMDVFVRTQVLIPKIVELPVVSSLVTLRHTIADNAVSPSAPIQFYPHAHGAFVVAVRVETDLASPKWWIQLLLGFQVGIHIPLEYLKINLH